MIDLKLDTSHDLVVTDLDLELVAGIDEVTQHLLVALKLFLGEWYLDEYAGMPYYREVMVSAPNSSVIEGIFRQAILAEDDIESIQEFALDIDRTTRKLSVDFTAVSSEGTVDIDDVFP